MRIIYDKIDFLEFKQNIILLKQPQHKASVFYDLSLEDFLRIRDFTKEIEEKISTGNKITIDDYERGLFELWSPTRSYPVSSTLIAKILMSEENYNSLFKYNN